MGKYAGLNLSYSGMVAKAKKDADAGDFAMHDYLKWVGSPHVHLQAVPEGSRFCCLFEGDQVGWHSDLRRVFPWHHRTPAVHRKLKPHEGQFLNLQFARSVKSPLHVFPCMSVSYQQVHPCPSAVELCSRARKREPRECWPPVGARCQFVIGSGAPPGAQLKAWPMKRRFAASVGIATMLGSN
jgi:hypothetical protein